MSHFTVLVNLPKEVELAGVESAVADALEPFWELDLPTEDLRDDPRSEFRVKYKGTPEEVAREIFSEVNVESTRLEYTKLLDAKEFDELIEDWGGYTKVGNTYGYYRNPNAKWDWYSIGGRWAGLFFHKKAKQACNYGRVSEVDFQDPVQLKKDRKFYKRFWEINIEGQPLTGVEKLKEGKYTSLYKKEYFTEFYTCKEEYVRRQTAFSTYAAVVDGKWLEKGQMGWFGCSSETAEESRQWEENYQKMLDSFDPESWVVVVDCHI